MRTAAVVSLNPASFEAIAVKGDWRTGIRRVRDLGFDGVELHLRDPALIPKPELLDLLGETGLAVPALGTGQVYGEDRLSFSDPRPEIRAEAVERVLRYVELSTRLPGRPLVIIGLVRGTVPEGVPAGVARQWAVECLLEVAELAGQDEVRMVLEPINRYETRFGNTVEEILDLIDAVGQPNVGVLADTFHMNIEEVDVSAALRRAGERLWHVHTADSNRWAPGQGHLDFPAVLETLVDLEYDGFLSCEILPKPDPDRAIELGALGLRRLLRGGERT